MLQDPNVERVIKNYTEPLQKQISMMQIELEALKQQCNIGAVSGMLPLTENAKKKPQVKMKTVKSIALDK